MAAANTNRKRMKRWELPGDIRFVTFSCDQRLPLLGNPAIRDLLGKSLAAVRIRFRLELYAWVIMPEHVHLMVRPHESAPLGRALHSLKFSVGQRVLARWRKLDAPILRKLSVTGRATRFWQRGGGFDRNVRDLNEFTREIRYIHQNPVKRKLAARPEDWRWSSVHWWMGRRDGEQPCDPLPGDPREWENWSGYV